jgi:hypothetical protein
MPKRHQLVAMAFTPSHSLHENGEEGS